MKSSNSDAVPSVEGTICQLNKCYFCCTETEMPLTRADIERIAKFRKIKFDVFTKESEDGMTVLRNITFDKENRCYFLNDNNKCSIYEIRPIGCRFYPLIWHLNKNKVIIDKDCPHYLEFNIDKKKVRKELESHVNTLFEEAKNEW